MAPRVADDLGFRWPVSKLHPLTYAWDMLAFLTFGSSFLLFRRAKKYLAPSADAVRSRDTRPPVLLLRSFRDDETRVLLSGWSASPWGTNRTLEELVVDCLAGHGPVVAIGRPGEVLLPLGAAREYVDHGSWQQRIRELVAEAERIVVLGGRTEGLLWELRTIADMRRLSSRCCGPASTAAARAAVWAGMREVLTQMQATTPTCRRQRDRSRSAVDLRREPLRYRCRPETGPLSSTVRRSRRSWLKGFLSRGAMRCRLAAERQCGDAA
jgi:hypothetical protein